MTPTLDLPQSPSARAPYKQRRESQSAYSHHARGVCGWGGCEKAPVTKWLCEDHRQYHCAYRARVLQERHAAGLCQYGGCDRPLETAWKCAYHAEEHRVRMRNRQREKGKLGPHKAMQGGSLMRRIQRGKAAA